VKGYAAFFSQHINNNTNEQYSRAIRAFFKYLDAKAIRLQGVTAAQVLTYIKYRMNGPSGSALSDVSIRLHISAIREFFNACVLCGALTANPAAAVKPPRLSYTEGSTPVIDNEDVTTILTHMTDNLTKQADYRDRAMIATMAYAMFRISAVLSFKVKDYREVNGQIWLYAQEKGGKRHKNPVHPKLRPLIDAHIKEANLTDKGLVITIV